MNFTSKHNNFSSLINGCIQNREFYKIIIWVLIAPLLFNILFSASPWPLCFSLKLRNQL